jgi:GNAT superfamily N-acetyltransferase
MEKVNIINKNPSVETYRHLRKIAGLSPKTAEAAEKGLRGTIFAVLIELEGEIVGMGRLIGDGGCHFQVVDIAVVPRHQCKGIGTRIMEEITQKCLCKSHRRRSRAQTLRKIRLQTYSPGFSGDGP